MGAFLDPGEITADRRQGFVTRVVALSHRGTTDAGIGSARILLQRRPPNTPMPAVTGTEKGVKRRPKCDGCRSVEITSAVSMAQTPVYTFEMPSLRPGGPSQGRATGVGDCTLSLRAQAMDIHPLRR